MALNIASPSELVKNVGFAHTAATVAKVPVVIATQAFIPINTADANEHNAYVYESEIDNAPTDTGAAWLPGEAVYWDAANTRFTKTATANTLCGHALQPKASGDAVSGLIAFNSFAAA